MALLRYSASADNVITNAFRSNLESTSRATGSNMGYADAVEVFSIYGQVSNSSGQTQELARTLIKFPTTAMAADRAASPQRLPDSGSVSWYLKMFNAEHPFTLPENFTLRIAPITTDWSEGTGLDMDEYKDRGVSNWTSATSPAAAATATVTWYTGDRPEIGDTITIIDAAGLSKTYIAAAAEDLTADPPEWYASNTTTTQVDSLQNCIESANGHDGSITVSQDGTGLIMTLTSLATGYAGNTTITVDGATSGQLSATDFSGGSSHTPWTAQGGDYSATQNYDITFPEGYENLETDITGLVEWWLNGGQTNYGVGVRLIPTQEAYAATANTGSGIIANTSGAKVTYYTKKFFARGTEFFFKRPVIEARWDSRTTDDRGNMYFSSSAVLQNENLYTLYYYNYVRGRLQNLPDTTNASGIANSKLKVCFYSGSSAPKGDRLKIWNGGTCVTASLVSGKTGIYNCQVALTAAATPVTKVFDVWFTASADSEVATATYATQSFNIAKIPNYQSVPTFEYDNTVTNLRSSYSKNETARFRVFSRNKSWNPNLYVKATSNIPTVVNQSASFAVFRTTDNLPVISYGTGSDMHTYMSYDLSGNYCDVNMNLLEPDYMYNIKFAFYNDSIGSWVEQPQTFKFRVEE